MVELALLIDLIPDPPAQSQRSTHSWGAVLLVCGSMSTVRGFGRSLNTSKYYDYVGWCVTSMPGKPEEKGPLAGAW